MVITIEVCKLTHGKLEAVQLEKRVIITLGNIIVIFGDGLMNAMTQARHQRAVYHDNKFEVAELRYLVHDKVSSLLLDCAQCCTFKTI